jgi:hypothetical protein
VTICFVLLTGLMAILLIAWLIYAVASTNARQKKTAQTAPAD